MSAEWPLKKLSDVAEFLNHKRVPLKSLDRDKRQGEYPYYGASGVVDHIDDYIFDGTFLLISEDGENLRTRTTPIAFKASGKFWVNNHAHILTEKEEGILDYLEYYFSKLDLTPFITGAVQPKLNKNNLDSVEIPIPPKEERLYVNRVLNSFTNKIELNRQTNQTLEQIAQAIFKSWFVDFEPTRAKIAAKQIRQARHDSERSAALREALLADERWPEVVAAAIAEGDPERAAMAAISGKSLDELSAEQQEQLRITANLFPDMLVDSELGEIPAGWEVDSIGSHVNMTKGRSYKSSELKESKIALVTLKSFMRGGGYREDGLKEYTGTYKPEQVIEPGELVMSLTDVTQAAEIVGKPAIVTRNDSYETLVASLDVAILRPNEPGLKEFFYGLMRTYRFHRYAESFATGTTVLHLNAKGITSFKFPLPDIGLCKVYADTAGPVLAKHEGNIHLSRSLEELRDSLLPKLLSGECAAEVAA